MAQLQSERVEKFVPFNLPAAEIAAETKKRIGQFANAQTQQLDKAADLLRLARYRLAMWRMRWRWW